MIKPKGEVRAIFPTAAVVRYRNPDHQDITLDGLKFFAARVGGVTSTPSMLNVLNELAFGTLKVFLENCVRDYLNNVYCYKYEGCEIIHSWVNRTPRGGFQPMHFHGNSIVSGVYYLKAKANESSPLCFDRPELNTQPYIAIATCEQTLFTANRVSYPASTGTAYLFPSQLRHGYEAPTREERISLAFNVMLTGIGLFYKL